MQSIQIDHNIQALNDWEFLHFGNDDWVMDDMDEQLIFETYNVHYIDKVPVYNETDPEQIIDYKYEDTYISGNTLVTNASFRLLGADPVDYNLFDEYIWLEDLEDNTEFVMEYQEITGEFVFIYDVPVVIDPRTSISNEQRIDEHGVQAWYDSNNDGIYEMCYEFTELSWEENLAVAVYISRSGLPIVYTDPEEYNICGDTVVATHWLSDKYGFDDIMGVAWDNAKEDGWDKYKTADFWAMWVTDTVFSAILISAIVAAALAPYIAIPLMIACFVVYQNWIRPLLQDIYEEIGLIEGEKGHELNKPPDHGITWTDSTGAFTFKSFVSTIGFYTVHPFVNIWEDMKTWYLGRLIPTYDMRVNFADADPFYQDQNPEEFDYNDDWNFFGWGDDNDHLSEDALVWVNYKIPQFYDSMSNGPQEMEYIDIFQMLKTFTGGLLDLNGWFTIFQGLESLNIKSGVPNYVIMGLHWFDERVPYSERYHYDPILDCMVLNEGVAEAQKLMMELLGTYHRHVMHQFYWRDTPTGEVDFWDDSEDPDEDWESINEIGRIETELDTYSKAGYNSTSFMVDDRGAPFLVATYNQELNYSDPNVYAVDYNMLCMISKYQAGYQAGLKSSFGLWWTNFGLMVVQTAISVAAGALTAAATSASAKAASIQSLEKIAVEVISAPTILSTTSFIKNLISGIVEELFWEEITQGFLSLTNLCPEFLSEAIAEGVGEGSINFGADVIQTQYDPQDFKILKKFSQSVRIYFNNQHLIQLTQGLTASTIRSIVNTPSTYKDAIKVLEAIQSQKITDTAHIQLLTYLLNSDVTIFKSGGTQNMISTLDQIKIMADTTLHEYNNNQIPLEELATLMKQTIAEICIHGSKDVLDLIYSLWTEAGLGTGKDGIFRTHHPEFFKKGVKYTVSIDAIVKDGVEKLILYKKQGNRIIEEVDLSLQPIGVGYRDITTWLTDGWQMKMVDPEEHIPLGPAGRITKSFERTEGVSWTNTEDFRIKIINNPELGHLVDISNPENSIGSNIKNQLVPYANELDVSGSKPVYNFVSNIGSDYPVVISANSQLSNTDIQNRLDPSNPLSILHQGANSIPYSMTLDPKFYELWLSGLVEIDSAVKFQFDSDLTMNQIIQHDFIQRIAKINDIQVKAISRLRGYKGTGSGQERFAIWDVEDWIQSIIPAPGQRNRRLTSGDGSTRPASYYSSIYMIAQALDTYYGPKYADMYMRSHLTPLEYFDHDPVPVWSDVAYDLYYNWRDIKGKIAFNQWFGDSLDNWVFFDYPADLNRVNSFVSSLELIAYFNIQKMTQVYYSKYSWANMNHHIKKLEAALNVLGATTSHSSIVNLFQNSPLSRFSAGKSHAQFNHMTLLSQFSRILVEPLNAIDSYLPIKQRLSSFINDIALVHYYDFDGWVSDGPLFVEEFNGKPYFGAFGEESSMTLTMGLGSGTGVTRDVSYIRNNEYRYLVSLKNNPTGDNLRPSVENVWGSELLGPLNLPGTLVLRYGPIGSRHNQFLDFIREDFGGVATADEIWGYSNRIYTQKKYSAGYIFILNGYPIIYRPGLKITANRIWNNFGSDSIIRVAPFFDNHQQDVRYEEIVGHVLDASILADPNNALHRHDVLFGMRIPENMENWGIYNFFSTQAKAVEWVDKIQLKFGIHVNPNNNFEFDYIINSPGITLPSPSNLPPSIAAYYSAITAVDPNYDPRLDPYEYNTYDPSLIPRRLDDLKNNYKYRWWIAYINYFAGLSPTNNFNLVMSYLNSNSP